MFNVDSVIAGALGLGTGAALAPKYPGTETAEQALARRRTLLAVGVGALLFGRSVGLPGRYANVLGGAALGAYAAEATAAYRKDGNEGFFESLWRGLQQDLGMGKE